MGSDRGAPLQALRTYGNSALTIASLVGAAPVFSSAWLCAQALLQEQRYPQAAKLWVDQWMYAEYQELARLIFQLWMGVEFVFHGDRPHAETALYISNHQCTVDWLIAPLLASQVGLTGHVQYILKSTLKLLPMYGWYFLMHGCIYVRKNSARNRPQLERELRRLAHRDAPFWLVLFPEGTRFRFGHAAALQASHDFATQRGLPRFNDVLVPRTTGLCLCVGALRPRLQAVYDLTIAYCARGQRARPPAPSMAGLMSWEYKVVHIHVARVPISAVPRGDTAVSAWAMERFVAKDRLMHDLYASVDEEGGCHAPSWDGPRWTHRPALYATVARVAAWASVLVPLLATSQGRRVWLLMALGASTGGSLLLL